MQSAFLYVSAALHVAADGWLACLYAHATTQLAV